MTLKYRLRHKRRCTVRQEQRYCFNRLLSYVLQIDGLQCSTASDLVDACSYAMQAEVLPAAETSLKRQVQTVVGIDWADPNNPDRTIVIRHEVHH